MKIMKQLSVAILLMIYLPLALAQSPDGVWTTVDDKTGQKRSWVRLKTNKGVLSGKIIKIYQQAGDKGICSKCPGQFKDKPIVGLTFLWGLKENREGNWSGGHILDPKSGKIYRTKLSIKGNELYVRGYVGFSVLGRTQVWHRSELQ